MRKGNTYGGARLSTEESSETGSGQEGVGLLADASVFSPPMDFS